MTTVAISPKMVAELREKTGAGMGDCKKALTDANGEMDKAINLLRERGAMKAAKRSDRAASEGLVAVSMAADHRAAALAELSSETDFAARNPIFVEALGSIATASLAAKAKTAEAANAAVTPTGTVAGVVSDVQARIGEKIELNRVTYLEGDIVASYVHHSGKVGVLVAATAPGLPPDKLEEGAEKIREVAMHIAATAPRFLDETKVDPATLANEREVAANTARNEGKPEQIIPKIVEGKVKAFFKESCLVHQPFVKDDSKTIAKVIEELSKSLGVPVAVKDYVRFQVGEKPAGQA